VQAACWAPAWVKHKDPAKISQIQRELIFSKHNGSVNSGRILVVPCSIVARLAKPDEKFIYGCRPGGWLRLGF